jgi:hypothetical protein
MLDDLEDKEAITKELEEREMELNNLLLFTNLPKQIEMIKQNDFLPYYDPTVEDKSVKISKLKNRINQLRHYLNLPDFQGNFYVEVRNSTFPKGPLDVLKNLNDSFYFVDTMKANDQDISNGKNKNVNSVFIN